MVKLPGKLDHFDFIHKKRLLEEQPPNMPLLQQYVLAPLEEGIDKFLSQQQSAHELATGNKSELPQLVPRAAAAYSTSARKIVQPDFFLSLLRIQTNRAKKHNNSPADVPLHRRHLIWRVPERCLLRQLRRPRLLDAVLGTKTAAASDASSPHPLAARGYLLISQALDLVRRELETVPPEAWTGDALPLAAEKGTELWALLSAQLEGNVPPESVDKKTEIAFSELVRWALVASDSAPPNREVMEFLGREESLERIGTAAEVARRAAEEPDWQPEGFDWSEAKK